MSIENAKQFLTKIYESSVDGKSLLPKGMVPQGIGANEIEAIAKAANAAGWDFSADELREAYLDALSCDETELAAVAGGADCGESFEHKENRTRAAGPGGCATNFYVEHCDATWETGSLCSCTDFGGFQSNYHRC